MSWAWTPCLIGGPWHLHVLVVDGPLVDELRFPTEPRLDLHGKPSIVAPRPTPDGVHVYRRDGRNIVGDHLYRYQEPPT